MLFKNYPLTGVYKFSGRHSLNVFSTICFMVMTYSCFARVCISFIIFFCNYFDNVTCSDTVHCKDFFLIFSTVFQYLGTGGGGTCSRIRNSGFVGSQCYCFITSKKFFHHLSFLFCFSSACVDENNTKNYRQIGSNQNTVFPR